MSGCTKDDPPDTEAPVIILKQSSLSIEAGDQIVPGSLVLSITDNKDQNPQITASIDNQTIAYQEAYTFSKAGDFDLRIKASDKSGNSSLSQVAINVGA